MAVAVQMPKQGNTVEECLLVEWRVKEGDSVKKGDILCAIETDKASFEVESAADGVVLRLLAAPGDLVPVLHDIALIGDAGERNDVLPAARPAAEPEPVPPPPAPAAPAESDPVAPPAPAETFKAASPRARRLADKLGIDVAAVAGSGVGGRVTSRDVQSAVDAGTAIKASPLAREIMAETGQRPAAASGIGGMARARDLADPAPRKAAVSMPEPEMVPYKGIRKLIGDRMTQSLAEHAQLTHHASADAVQLTALRKVFKDGAATAGLPGIGINDLVCWVAAQTLPSFPEINAVMDKAAGVIARHRGVNLAFAVDTPRGLMVPVVPGANLLSLAELAGAMAALAADCRKGSVNPDSLTGGTFTVSNLGNFGVESFTPIINGNQVAILGVCAISQTPAPAPNGGVEFRPRIGLSLTYDHQAVDGAPASRFLQAVAKGIEQVGDSLALVGAAAGFGLPLQV